MDDDQSLLQLLLNSAAWNGDVPGLRTALAEGANPDIPVIPGAATAFQVACERGQAACVREMLAAGANPNAHGDLSEPPLFMAAFIGATECVEALLAAGADPTARSPADEWSALHCAARSGSVGTASALLAAAPRLALLCCSNGFPPLDVALGFRRHEAPAHPDISMARCLLERGALPPASELLASLEAALLKWQGDAILLPLYAPLVARQPLSPAEWARVPVPCPGLGAALPAVLGRSAAEAALLVHCLPASDRQRLRTAALCLKRVERRQQLSLPAELLRPLLLAAVAAAEE